MNTGVANAMFNAGDKATLDRHVKNLFGHKGILVVLMKYCVPEFANLSPQYMMEHCFVGEPVVSRAPVDRDVPTEDEASVFPPCETDGLDLNALIDGNERVSMLNTEDRTQNEGTAIYDIVFQARIPSDGSVISLLINVEIQNDEGLSYAVVTRGLYYCGRLLSAQKDRLFRRQEYQKLQKVYSIWICPYSRRGRNSIATYNIRETVVEGDCAADKADYDKLETIVIGFNADGLESANELIRFLALLLNRELPVEERQRLIEKEYHIAMTEDIVEDVKQVCNYSDAIEQKGRVEGRNEGRAEGFEMLGRLISKLLELGRNEDVARVACDPAYRDKLMAEFRLA